MSARSVGTLIATVPSTDSTAPFCPEWPAHWDAPRILAHVHQMGASLGLVRERIDRHRFPGDEWFEAGYGPIGTVTVRTSWGPQWIVTMNNYRPERFHELLELLVSRAGV